jgi:hypothetical protein
VVKRFGIPSLTPTLIHLKFIVDLPIGIALRRMRGRGLIEEDAFGGAVISPNFPRPALP